MRLASLLLLVPAVAAADKKIDLNKTIGGSWSCKGSVGSTSAKARLVSKKLDKTWIQQELRDGNGDVAYELFTTMDGNGRIRRVVIGAGGTTATGEGKLAGSKLDFDLDRKADGGDGKFREHLDWSDTKKGLVFTGELDNGGGKWVKSYDLVCTQGANDVIALMGQFKDRMCGCKDKACADKVNDDYTKVMTELAKDTDYARPTDDEIKKATDLAQHYADCMAKAMGAGSP